MGRYFTVTNSSDYQPGIKKRTIQREIVIGPTAIKFITIAIFAVLGLIYLTQSTAGANRSIKVREIDSQKQRLELKKEQLEVEKYRSKSLREIDSQVEKPQMEPVSKVDHIKNSQNDLARNN